MYGDIQFFQPLVCASSSLCHRILCSSCSAFSFQSTGSPLLPTFIIADATRTHCTFYVEPPIEVAHTSDRDADVREATARIVAVYERFVRKYPEQWFNFFDFWNPPAPPRPMPAPAATANART